MSLPASTGSRDAGTPAATGRRSRSWPARLLTGLLVMLLGFMVWRELEPVLFFRPVGGVVVWSEVVMTIAVSGRRKMRYDAQITYRYEVNGESFLSSQYRRTNMVASHPEATRRARRHVMGTRVQAWYSPLNPADAVLARAPNFVLIAVLGLVGFMVWLFSLASTRRRTPGAPPPAVG